MFLTTDKPEYYFISETVKQYRHLFWRSMFDAAFSPNTWKHFQILWISPVTSVKVESNDFWIYDIKPFVPNAPFLYPLKTSENRKESNAPFLYPLKTSENRNETNAPFLYPLKTSGNRKERETNGLISIACKI